MGNHKLDFFIDDNGCFICSSHKAKTTKGKYSTTRVVRNGKTTTLPRWIYGICFGELPPELVVRHKCNNAYCINPEHLISGTPKQNTQDMIDSGRNTNGKRILTIKQAKNIKMLLKNGFKPKDIAYAYEVSESTIRDIKQSRSWTDENIKRWEAAAKGEL